MSADSITATSTPCRSKVADVLREIFLWGKKKLSVLVLIMATAIWVLLEIFQFTFVTVASWIAISVVASTFLWSNLLALFGKEVPSLSQLELSEQTTLGVANTLRTCLEEELQWMFRVAVERDLMVLAPMIVGLLILSLLGSNFDFLTLLYIGVVMGFVFPVMYIKYEDAIMSCGERMRMQGRRWHEMMDEKVLSKMMKKKTVSKEIKVE